MIIIMTVKTNVAALSVIIVIECEIDEDERETGRVTELPVRPTHSGGEPQKRPGNILYVMWMTYDWSALIYEVF